MLNSTVIAKATALMLTFVLASSAEPEGQVDSYADFLAVSQKLSKRVVFQSNGRSLIDVISYLGKEEGIAVYVDASVPADLVLHSEKHTKVPDFPDREVTLYEIISQYGTRNNCVFSVANGFCILSGLPPKAQTGN